jgi:hypothetical protein
MGGGLDGAERGISDACAVPVSRTSERRAHRHSDAKECAVGPPTTANRFARAKTSLLPVALNSPEVVASICTAPPDGLVSGRHAKPFRNPGCLVERAACSVHANGRHATGRHARPFRNPRVIGREHCSAHPAAWSRGMDIRDTLLMRARAESMVRLKYARAECKVPGRRVLICSGSRAAPWAGPCVVCAPTSSKCKRDRAETEQSSFRWWWRRISSGQGENRVGGQW